MRLNGQHEVVLTHNYCDHLYTKGACKPQYALQAWGQKHLNNVATPVLLRLLTPILYHGLSRADLLSVHHYSVVQSAVHAGFWRAGKYRNAAGHSGSWP